MKRWLARIQRKRRLFYKEDRTNQPEFKNFILTAWAFRGSVTPIISKRMGAIFLYSVAVVLACQYFPHVSMDITPFEFWGAIMGLILIQRVNNGLDRWWEARKLWGSIVNQSRNLAIILASYTPRNNKQVDETLLWVASLPHSFREFLRKENKLTEIRILLGEKNAELLRLSEHLPTQIALQIGQKIHALHQDGTLNAFAFQRAERERAILIDCIGACERIQNTPIPFSLAIEIRRFLFLYLAALPIGLAEQLDWLAPFVVLLVAYPLLALDQIGLELQSPFQSTSISHLPLTSICRTIETNILEILETKNKDTLQIITKDLPLAPIIEPYETPALSN